MRVQYGGEQITASIEEGARGRASELATSRKGTSIGSAEAQVSVSRPGDIACTWARKREKTSALEGDGLSDGTAGFLIHVGLEQRNERRSMRIERKSAT